MGGHSRWLHAVLAAALVLLMSVPQPCDGAGATAYFEPDVDTTRTTNYPRIPPSPYRGIMGPNCPPPVSKVTTASNYGVFGYPGALGDDEFLQEPTLLHGMHAADRKEGGRGCRPHPQN